MPIEVQTRFLPMMPIRNILCIAIATLLSLSPVVFGGDSVIVELKSGRRLVGQSITENPDQVILKTSTANIQMERIIARSLIAHISIPPSSYEEPHVADNTSVSDTAPPAPSISPSTSNTPLPQRHSPYLLVGCDRCGGLPPYDPGVIVGVRDLRCPLPPCSYVRPDCRCLPVQP